MAGRLFLVPTPLDFGCEQTVPLREVLPDGTIAAAAGLTHWICENAKSARAFASARRRASGSGSSPASGASSTWGASTVNGRCSRFSSSRR